MRNNKPKRPIVKFSQYIPVYSLKSNNGNINIIEGGLRGFDYSNSQYFDFSFELDPLYIPNSDIEIKLIIGKKLEDRFNNLKFKLEMKPSDKTLITKDVLMSGSEGEYENFIIHKFKVKKPSKIPLYLGRITRIPIVDAHPNPIWIMGVEIHYPKYVY